jgi:hypothetical protein
MDENDGDAESGVGGCFVVSLPGALIKKRRSVNLKTPPPKRDGVVSVLVEAKPTSADAPYGAWLR